MSRSKEKAISRSSLNLGIFKDLEADWIFKRTIAYMGEKAAELGECLIVAERIDQASWRSWVDEWSRMAEQVEKHGQESLSRGHPVSARECFLRASNYYRAAEYGDMPSDSRFHMLWTKSRECFQQACRLFSPPIQPIEVQFEGKKLPGYFWRPTEDPDTTPTIVVAGGNDSSLEELAFGMGMAAVRRGYNFFSFDHPGHRGAVHLYPDCVKRHDLEVPYKAALDHLEGIPGVDERIALTGISFGGYAAVRVAAYERRIKAVIPNNPVLDPLEALTTGLGKMAQRIPLSLLEKLIEWKTWRSPLRRSFMEYSAWTRGEHGLTYIEGLKKSVGTLNKGESLWQGLVRTNKYVITEQDMKRIGCPVLALVGEDDGEIYVRQAKRLIDNVSSTRKDLHVFRLSEDGSSDHVQLDNRSRGNQVTFDWLDEVFSYTNKTSTPDNI